MNLHAQLLSDELEEILTGVNIKPEYDKQKFVSMNPGLVMGHITLNAPEYVKASSLNLFYHVSRYIACGCKDFIVMPTISSMLDDASLETDPRMLRAPYPSFTIEPPEDFGIISNPTTGEHKIWMFYVTMDEKENHKELRVMLIGKKNKNSINPLDDAVYYFTMELYNDIPISDSFAKQYDGMEKSLKDLNTEEDVAVLRYNLESSKRYLAYCINTTLYAISSNADSKWKSVYPAHIQNKIDSLKDEKRIKKLRKLNQKKLVRKCILGASVKSVTPSKSIGKRWELQKRIYVRGHFHGYWYKTDTGKELRPKWVYPYWKGPEKADQIHTKFQVGEDN